MEMTLTDAVQMTGKSKSTLLRAVNGGRLSARRTDEGAFMVDASELARVFPIKPMKRVSEAGMVRHDAPRSEGEAGDASREAELVELRMKVAVQSAQLEEKATQLDRERETVEDLRKRLDRAEERVYALTYQALEPTRSKGFIERLVERIKAGI